jgi:transcriptional regulator with XRE-family HTH domain
LTDDDQFPPELFSHYPDDKRSVVERLVNLTSGAMRLASSARGVSRKVGKAIMSSPEHLRRLEETGLYLRDLREVAGLTLDELSEALELKDESVLAAVENGTSTISFELVLRLAALVARHDPIPFIMQFVRTYNPELWEILEAWGVDKIPLHYERERLFINIYRSRDEARTLSEEGFEKVLAHTKTAFDMALHFVEEQELALAQAVAELEPEEELDETLEDDPESEPDDADDAGDSTPQG